MNFWVSILIAALVLLPNSAMAQTESSTSILPNGMKTVADLKEICDTAGASALMCVGYFRGLRDAHLIPCHIVQEFDEYHIEGKLGNLPLADLSTTSTIDQIAAFGEWLERYPEEGEREMFGGVSSFITEVFPCRTD